MKFLSWNINGLRSMWKKGLLDVLGAEAADVVCLQETKLQAEQVTDEMREPLGYRSYWSFAERKGYSGVATYLRAEPLAAGARSDSPVLDVEGRMVHTELPDFHLFNVYFPNGGMGPERVQHKLAFYEAFLTLTESLRKRGKGVVVCGDVNTAHTELDLARPRENERTSGFLPAEREWVSRFIAAGYHDTFTPGGTSRPDRAPAISAGASTTSSSPTSCGPGCGTPRSCPTWWDRTTARSRSSSTSPSPS